MLYLKLVNPLYLNPLLAYTVVYHVCYYGAKIAIATLLKVVLSLKYDQNHKVLSAGNNMLPALLYDAKHYA